MPLLLFKAVNDGNVLSAVIGLRLLGADVCVSFRAIYWELQRHKFSKEQDESNKQTSMKPNDSVINHEHVPVIMHKDVNVPIFLHYGNCNVIKMSFLAHQIRHWKTAPVLLLCAVQNTSVLNQTCHKSSIFYMINLVLIFCELSWSVWLMTVPLHWSLCAPAVWHAAAVSGWAQAGAVPRLQGPPDDEGHREHHHHRGGEPQWNLRELPWVWRR